MRTDDDDDDKSIDVAATLLSNLGFEPIEPVRIARHLDQSASWIQRFAGAPRTFVVGIERPLGIVGSLAAILSKCGQRIIASAECERERFQTGVEELDLELAIGDRSRLSNQLIQALLGDRASPLVVDVTSMVRAGRLPVD